MAKLVENLTAYPGYYAHMGALNEEGPGPIDLSPPQSVDAAELRRRVDAGEWVVDLRDRKVYPDRTPARAASASTSAASSPPTSAG